MNGRMESDIKREKEINEQLEKLPDYVKEWDLNLKAAQKTTASRRDMVYKMSYFLTYLNPLPMDVKIEDIKEMDVQKFFISLQTKKIKGKMVETSDSYRCTYWYCLKNFFTYMVKRNYIASNPMTIIEKPKNHDLQRINQNRKLLTEEDFNKILASVTQEEERYSWWEISRNRLILLLFMTTGMRETALAEINMSDVNLSEGTLTVIDKGKKAHVYYLNSNIIEKYNDWMEWREFCLDWFHRNNHWEVPTDALFLNRKRERITATELVSVVKFYSKKALGYKISPHKLRSGYASILYNKTHDVEFVRKAVGHSDIATTLRYIVTDGEERKKASEMITSIFE